jgi:hypothetical protein
MSRRILLATLLLLLLGPLPVRAQPSGTLVRLAPSASSVAAERTRALELRLSRTLAGWPAIEHAEVLLQLPRADEQPLDEAPARPSASVVLTRSARPGTSPESPSRDEVFQLLHAAVPGLTTSDLTLLSHAAPLAPRDTGLLRIGPLEVSERTAPVLRFAGGISLAIHALFAGIVLWRLRQNRPAARKVDPRARTPSPP